MRFWCEAAGVISTEPCWCVYHEGYLYTAPTFLQLLRVMTRELRSDRHLVG